jgi:predicted nucleic acid-binding protein
MILVDSSVWIDYFNGVQSRETDALDQLMGSPLLLVGDLILAEVLLGFRSEVEIRRALGRFEAFALRDIAGHAVAIASARNYRFLRRMGVTVRTTIDTIIATFCILKNHELFHCDRDFDPFERHLGLRVFKV